MPDTPSQIVQSGDYYVPLEQRLVRIEHRQQWSLFVLLVVLMVQLIGSGSAIADILLVLGVHIP